MRVCRLFAIPKIGDFAQFLPGTRQSYSKVSTVLAGTPGKAVRRSPTSTEKRLGVILTGHSIAEESVLYPALPFTPHIGRTCSGRLRLPTPAAHVDRSAQVDRAVIYCYDAIHGCRAPGKGQGSSRRWLDH
jgi:hypothetical protein